VKKYPDPGPNEKGSQLNRGKHREKETIDRKKTNRRNKGEPITTRVPSKINQSGRRAIDTGQGLWIISQEKIDTKK